jgi:lipopolysaccharide transport protein LptA
MKRFLLVILSTYLFSGVLLSSQCQPLSSSTTGSAFLSTDQPYEMYGDKFRSSTINKTRISKLIGHAKLVLINDKITVTADEIWYYSDAKKLQAFHNVTIFKEDAVNGNTTATADNAEYMEIERKTLLTGSPKVIQGKNEIKGNKITIEFLDSGANLEIEGNVFGLIYPKSSEPKKVE